MILVPKHELHNKLRHLAIAGATTASGSNSFSAPGTGLVFIPVYFTGSASAVGSMRYVNGTSGTTLFTVKFQAGGNVEFSFWEEPSQMAANKAAYLEAETAGLGVHDAHVWVMTVRGGAGGDALGQ